MVVCLKRSIKTHIDMIETLSSPRATKLSAKEMVEKLASQEEFERNRREGYNFERSLARTALEHVGMQLGDELEEDIEDAYEPNVSELTPELALEEVVGTLPAFVVSRVVPLPSSRG